MQSLKDYFIKLAEDYNLIKIDNSITNDNQFLQRELKEINNSIVIF